MSKKKDNKELLNEELNRFKMMSEYAFYEDRGGDEEEAIEDLLLGNMTEEEEELENEKGGDEEFSFDEPEEGGEEGAEEEVPADDEGAEEEPSDDEFDFGGEEPVDDLEMDAGGDEVELDVTELVNQSEEAKAAADAATMSANAANEKMDKLMGMVDKLEKQADSMSVIAKKIDDLEGELEKRMPTEEEKLELRSLDSGPFNLRLGDFWGNQEGQYDVMSDKDKEYVLNKDEIEADYSDANIKNSFDIDNEYEEEEF